MTLRIVDQNRHARSSNESMTRQSRRRYFAPLPSESDPALDHALFRRRRDESARVVVLLFTLSIDSALAQSGAQHRIDGTRHRFQRRGHSRRGRHAHPCRDRQRADASPTSATGDWEARFLAPGTYRVIFELAGFKTLRRDGVTVSTAEMATVNVTLEIGTLAEAVEVVANAGDGVVGLDDRVAHAGSAGARGAADVGAQLHAAPGHRAGRLRRHQRAAVERQRVDLAERERRAHDQQQLRLQRRRRHQPAVLQQPHQRRERHDRQRRRLAVAQRRARARDAAGGEAADQPLRRRHRPQRRRQLHAGLEERHQHASAAPATTTTRTTR